MTAGPCPPAETVAAACPRHPLAGSRPAADNGPHQERSFRVTAEEPARAEPLTLLPHSLTMPLCTVRSNILAPAAGPVRVPGLRRRAG
jgi:hypothetical protein